MQHLQTALRGKAGNISLVGEDTLFHFFINVQCLLENRMELGLKLSGQTTVVANSLMQDLVLPIISCQSNSTSTGNICIHAKFSKTLGT